MSFINKACLAGLCLGLLASSVSAVLGVWIDTFNRGDNTDLGASWDAGYTSHVRLDLVGNAVRASAVATSNNYETINAITLPNDQMVRATIKTSAGAAQVYHCLRLRATAPATNTAMHFCVVRNNGSLKSYISKVVTGTETQLVSDNTTNFVTGDQMLVSSIGNTHTLSRIPGGTGPPVQILQTTNADIPTGSRAGLLLYIGAGGALSDGEFDDFTVLGSGGRALLLNVGP